MALQLFFWVFSPSGHTAALPIAVLVLASENTPKALDSRRPELAQGSLPFGIPPKYAEN